MQAGISKTYLPEQASTASSVRRYTWYPSSYRPYESLWSLLQRFAVLNQCSATDLRRIFGRTGRHCAPYIWSKAEVNLTVLGALNRQNLGHLFQLTDQQISEATVRWYLRAHECGLAGQQDLRICPDCYRSGFHSPLYQLRLLAHCPIHNTPLFDVCPECGYPLPLYELRSDAFANPYHCSHCAALWWPDAHRGGHTGDLDHDRGAQLQDLAEWLLTRKGITTIERNVEASLRWSRSSYAKLTEGLQRAAFFWGYLHRLPPPPAIQIAPPAEIAYHAVIQRISPPSEREPTDDDIWLLYKSVRRFLMRQAKPHRRCFRHLIKRMRTTPHCFYLPTPDLCPEAYAMMIWRAYLERHYDEHPENMFDRHSRRSIFFERISYHFSRNGALPSWAHQRVFALHALVFFEESRRDARRAIREGRKEKYHLSAVIDWLAQSRGESTCLHWWKTPFTTSRHH